MAPPSLEVVIVGCGTPNFSMGWLHLAQLLQEECLQPYLAKSGSVNNAGIAGVVEPFFLSPEGAQTPGAQMLQAWAKESLPEGTPLVGSSKELGELLSARKGVQDKERTSSAAGAAVPVRVGVVSMRAGDCKKACEDLIEHVENLRAIYLEKPGAASVKEIEELERLCDERGVTVMVGYSRNVGRHTQQAVEHERAHPEAPNNVTLIHSNPWKDEEMAECFRRCRPGILFDMACHDLAMAISLYGLSSDTDYADFTVDLDGCVQTELDGITDFVRLKFSLRPSKSSPRVVTFVIDRQTGSFNGIYVDGAKFLCGEDPLYENPLPELSSHVACQYDLYVEAKRIFFKALVDSSDVLASDPKATVPLPASLPTLKIARDVITLAERLTKKLQAMIPMQDMPSSAGVQLV